MRGLIAALGPVLVLLLASCGNKRPESEASRTAKAPAEAGELVEPPFEVRGELDGLLLVWFDEGGLHTAQRRSDIPEGSRARVRVMSLNASPEQRGAAGQVFVADLREPQKDGSFQVRKMSRAVFERLVDERTGAALNARAAAGSGDQVILYRTAWCGACRAAARYLREHEVSFVEKDIEEDPAAAREMQHKARQAGVDARGVPLIDFEGTILAGFDRSRLDQLLQAR